MVGRSPSRSPPGYHGRFLRVDLTTGTARPGSVPEGVLRRFLGGSGLGTYLLLGMDTAAVDPLSPAAALVLAFGPLAGSPLTASAKFAVVSKSPLTERINDSLCGGPLAIAGKQAGYDAIVLVGRAVAPAVLIIDEDRVSIEPADQLWGASATATQAALRVRLGNDFQVAAIGPAGERLVRYATLSHGRRHAGRGGSGAVLGAKNIKAIAVRGTQPSRWARPAALVERAGEITQRALGPATAKYRELGTVSNLLAINRLHALPVRNFQQATLPSADRLAPEHWATARAPRTASCASCAISCEHSHTLPGQNGASTAAVRLEYEHLFALGPLCGIDDPDSVLEAARQCDELGVDAISAGGTIAFAMECAQRGLLRAPWLRFGQGPALLRALALLGQRRALGDLLAEGSRRMAARIGRGSIAFAPQVKGLEIPGYEPRALQTMALGFAVGTRGADHNRSGAYAIDLSPAVDRRHARLDAARHAVATEDQAAIADSLVLCKFLRGALDDFFTAAAGLLELVTGWDITAAELRATAGRIVTAKKYFNVLAGWTPDEDTLPRRFLCESLPEGAGARLSARRLQTLVAHYNTLRGWSPEGWVNTEQVAALGLAPGQLGCVE